MVETVCRLLTNTARPSWFVAVGE